MFVAWAKIKAPGLRTGPLVRIHRTARVYCSRDAPVVLGAGTELERGALVASHRGQVHIGERSKVGHYSVLHGHGGLSVGSDVLIAHHVCIIAANHRFDDPARVIAEQGETREGIVIDSDVWIGSNVSIMDGVRVGRGAVIAAGAVVTRDVEPFAVVAGVPARQIKQRSGDAA
jgi:acetyltransferase-like isoleucine patch superfamily enzyme